PEDFGVPRASIGDLLGGDREQNAEIIRAILAGEPGPKRDIVLMNASAALVAGGRARDLKEGVELAARSIDSSTARQKLGRLVAGARRTRILEGALRPGARLDNQRRLAKSFGVTLMTLRQALELLEREHLIARRHGLGTFVAAPSIDYDILQLRRFAGDLSAKGEHVATRLLGARFAAPDRRVAEALRLPARARVFVLERLRLVDDHPMSLQRSFLPPLIGDEVVRADLARTPLHQVLEFKLGVVIVRAHETVSA